MVLLKNMFKSFSEFFFQNLTYQRLGQCVDKFHP